MDFYTTVEPQFHCYTVTHIDAYICRQSASSFWAKQTLLSQLVGSYLWPIRIPSILKLYNVMIWTMSMLYNQVFTNQHTLLDVKLTKKMMKPLRNCCVFLNCAWTFSVFTSEEPGIKYCSSLVNCRPESFTSLFHIKKIAGLLLI